MCNERIKIKDIFHKFRWVTCKINLVKGSGVNHHYWYRLFLDDSTITERISDPAEIQGYSAVVWIFSFKRIARMKFFFFFSPLRPRGEKFWNSFSTLFCSRLDISLVTVAVWLCFFWWRCGGSRFFN